MRGIAKESEDKTLPEFDPSIVMADRGVRSSPNPVLPRTRTLLGRAVLAAIAGIFYGTIIHRVCLNDLPELAVLLLYLSLIDAFFLMLVAPLLAKSWRPALVLGVYPPRSFLKRYSLLAFPLVAVAIASVFLLYLPLSYVAPRIVEWQILDDLTLISETSVAFNVFVLFNLVVVAPVFEEFLFRGLLLTRWSIKWSVPWAVFLSSALFAILHVDIIGAFFFGYVMCTLYIHTRSLLVPMILHAAYNGIAWILASCNVLISGYDGYATLAEFQSYWWEGLIAAVLAAPWVYLFVRRHTPMASWRVPYLALQEKELETAGQGS